jgi:transposase
MTNGEYERRIAQMEAKIAVLEQIIEDLRRENADLRARLAKDSHNSSKPPSSDGLKRRPFAPRPKSGRNPGGQPGHAGHTLERVAHPDQLVTHRPTHCAACHADLSGVAGIVVERRQVHDVPPLHLEATDHVREAVQCPMCQHTTRGRFPADVGAPVQYGPHLRALATYLHHVHLLPYERACQALEALCGARISERTLECWEQEAAHTVRPQVQRIADYAQASRHGHGDETGYRLNGRLHWLHTFSTRWLTFLFPHAKRGREALDAQGIWPRFRGVAMHDRWASYAAYGEQHQWCKAHLIRDLTFVHDTYHQEWAARMRSLLSAMHAARREWTERGQDHVPEAERAAWVEEYFAILCDGYASLQPATPIPKRRGRAKQHPAKNLLDALSQHAEWVIGFLDDGTLPFTNNLAERDLRMCKVQQKISGAFRSDSGVAVFCALRSYLATLQKQGHSLLAALTHVFLGHPLPVAWGT